MHAMHERCQHVVLDRIGARVVDQYIGPGGERIVERRDAHAGEARIGEQGLTSAPRSRRAIAATRSKSGASAIARMSPRPTRPVAPATQTRIMLGITSAGAGTLNAGCQPPSSPSHPVECADQLCGDQRTSSPVVTVTPRVCSH